MTQLDKESVNNMVDWPFVHKEQYKQLSEEAGKLYIGLQNIFRERDSSFIAPNFKEGFQPPNEIKLRTISETDYKRLKRLDKMIDEVRAKLYG